MRENMMHDGGGIPADFEKDPVAAAASAATTSAQSYTKVIKMVPVVGKTYKFWFTYLYEDPETKQVTESANSPIFSTSFTIPNGTLPVTDLVLTSGIKSYGVKFNVNPASVQTDILIFESLTGSFTGEEYIVYTGTSTNITVQVDSFAPRWVKVTVRDNWLDANRSSVTAGPVNILANDPDTSTPPKAPTGVSVSGVIDPEDKSGFSIQMDVSWTASTDSNTNGYVIRWSANDPSTVTNPLWEYGQVDGRATNKFSITGLTPNTVYYWQVTAKSPFNAISWDKSVTGQVASGQFGPISDPNAPAGNIQLRSIISIGGKLADLFKIGTGITQTINTSTTITPSQTLGTYNGIILDRSTTNYGHNYWLNTGQFRVGSASAFFYWDGSDVYTTGKINATGGSFTGDVRLNGGTLYTGPTPLSGARVRFDSAGLFGYDATSTSNTTGQTFALTAADGKIDARLGYIGGWTIQGTAQTVGTISKNGTILGSDGSIVLGDTTGTLASIVKLSSTDPTYRIWVGSQLASNAKFKVGVDGVVYANGAVIDGNASFSGTLTIGTKLSDGTTLDQTRANALAAIGSASAAADKAEIARLKGVEAYDKAVAAGDSAAAAAEAARVAKEAADLKMASADINTVLAYNTTIINGNRITTGTIDVARLNITGGTAGVNGFAVDGNGIRAYNGSNQTLNIASNGTISLGDTTNGWTVNNRYITSRSYYTSGYTQLVLDGWNGSITGGRISGTSLEGNTITGNTITGGTIVGTKIQTSTSSNRVEIVDATTDSLRVVYGGTVRGHLLAAASSGILMHYGSTANLNATTYGLLLLGSASATIAADSNNYLTLTSTNTTLSGAMSFINGTSTFGSVYHTYFQKTTDGAAAPSTTGSGANAYLNPTTGQLARSTSSTIRIKENIVDLTSVLDLDPKSLYNLPVRAFRFKEGQLPQTDLRYGQMVPGFIAEEVAEIYPPGVDIGDDGLPENWNFRVIVPAMLSLIQDLNQRIKELEA